MRLFRANGRLGGWLTALAVGLFGFATARAGGHGEKIEFSEPSTPVVASNLSSTVAPTPSRLNPEPNRFRQVQEDLFRPLTDALDAQNPVQFGTTPPPDYQQQSRQTLSRRARNQLEQRKNWAFTDLEDLYPEQSVEQALGIKDNELDPKNKYSTSLIQRYYDRRGEKLGANGNQPNAQIYNPKKQDFTGDSSPQFSESESFFSRNIFSDKNSEEESVLNPRDAMRAQQIADTTAAAEKQHRQEFGRLLDPNMPADKTGNSLFGDNATPNPLFGQTGTFTQPAQPVQPHHSVLYPVGIKDPAADALHSSVFDDPTAQALGMPNPAPFKPQPPSVTVESIQKMLNPYNANMAKRKF